MWDIAKNIQQHVEKAGQDLGLSDHLASAQATFEDLLIVTAPVSEDSKASTSAHNQLDVNSIMKELELTKNTAADALGEAEELRDSVAALKAELEDSKKKLLQAKNMAKMGARNEVCDTNDPLKIEVSELRSKLDIAEETMQLQKSTIVKLEQSLQSLNASKSQSFGETNLKRANSATSVSSFTPPSNTEAAEFQAAKLKLQKAKRMLDAMKKKVVEASEAQSVAETQLASKIAIIAELRANVEAKDELMSRLTQSIAEKDDIIAKSMKKYKSKDTSTQIMDLAEKKDNLKPQAQLPRIVSTIRDQPQHDAQNNEIQVSSRKIQDLRAATNAAESVPDVLTPMLNIEIDMPKKSIQRHESQVSSEKFAEVKAELAKTEANLNASESFITSLKQDLKNANEMKSKFKALLEDSSIMDLEDRLLQSQMRICSLTQKLDSTRQQSMMDLPISYRRSQGQSPRFDTLQSSGSFKKNDPGGTSELMALRNRLEQTACRIAHLEETMLPTGHASRQFEFGRIQINEIPRGRQINRLPMVRKVRSSSGGQVQQTIISLENQLAAVRAAASTERYASSDSREGSDYNRSFDGDLQRQVSDVRASQEGSLEKLNNELRNKSQDLSSMIALVQSAEAKRKAAELSCKDVEATSLKVEADLKLKIQDSANRIEMLEQQISKYCSVNQELKLKHTSALSAIEKLKKKLKDVELKLDNGQVENKSLSQRVAVMKDEKSVLEDHMSSSAQALSRQQEEIEQLKSKNSMLLGQVENYSLKLSEVEENFHQSLQLEEKEEKLQAKIKALEALCDGLRAEIEVANNGRANALSAFKKCESALADIQMELEKAEIKMKLLLEEKEELNSTTQSRFKDLEAQISQLQNDKIYNSKIIKDLRNELLESSINSKNLLEETTNSLNLELEKRLESAIESERMLSEKNIEIVKSEVMDKTNTIDELSGKVSELDQKLKEANFKIDALKKVESDCANFQRLLQESKLAQACLTTKLEKAEELAQSEKSLTAERQKRFSILNNQFKTKEKEYQAKLDEVENSKAVLTRLSDAIKEATLAKSEIDKLSLALNESKNLCEKLQSDCTSQKASLTFSLAEVQRHKDKIECLLQQYAALQAESIPYREVDAKILSAVKESQLKEELELAKLRESLLRATENMTLAEERASVAEKAKIALSVRLSELDDLASKLSESNGMDGEHDNVLSRLTKFENENVMLRGELRKCEEKLLVGSSNLTQFGGGGSETYRHNYRMLDLFGCTNDRRH